MFNGNWRFNAAVSVFCVLVGVVMLRIGCYWGVALEAVLAVINMTCAVALCRRRGRRG